eukprot:gene22959-10934_t
MTHHKHGKKPAKKAGPQFKEISGSGKCSAWTKLLCPEHFHPIHQGLSGPAKQSAWDSYG